MLCLLVVKDATYLKVCKQLIPLIIYSDTLSFVLSDWSNQGDNENTEGKMTVMVHLILCR